MKIYSNSIFLHFVWIIFLVMSCADIDSDTGGYASMQVKLKDVSRGESYRFNSPRKAPNMTADDASDGVKEHLINRLK